MSKKLPVLTVPEKRIMGFLADNAGFGYRSYEIADELGYDLIKLRLTLADLSHAGYIKRSSKGLYRNSKGVQHGPKLFSI